VRDDVEVAVMSLRGRTVGFLPFHRSRSNVGRPIGMRLCDLQGAVVEEGVEWDAGQVVRDARLIALHYDNLLVSQRQVGRFHWGIAPSPFIDLSGGFEKYRAQRRGAGSEQLLQVLRKTRKLEREVGPIRFEWHTTDRSVFEALLRWKSDKRRKTNTFNVLELDWVVRLLDRLRADETDDSRGVLSAMFVGDRLAAAHLGLRNRRTMHFWFSAYDRELGKYSPGLVMILSMIRASEHHGVTCIHLGKGLEQFKLGLMTDSVPVATGSVARSGMSWVAGSAWYRTRQWLRTSSLRGALLIPKRAIRNRQHQSAMR
jgi:CelD/BcsL family acetyltransferase involved in cellulose biosynthesis